MEGQDYYKEVRPGVFKNTERGLRLRENDPYSVKYVVQFVKFEARTNMEALALSVKTGVLKHFKTVIFLHSFSNPILEHLTKIYK